MHQNTLFSANRIASANITAVNTNFVYIPKFILYSHKKFSYFQFLHVHYDYNEFPSFNEATGVSGK